jgi:alpha-D-xyloside xylohydrolase
VRGTDVLRLTVCSDDVMHVVASPGGTATKASIHQPWLADPDHSCAGSDFAFREDAKEAVVRTAKVEVHISKQWGNLTFVDAKSYDWVLEEFKEAPRRYNSARINNEDTLEVSDRFYPAVQEALYGLGQHQSGAFNYRGNVVELGQANTDVAVPLLTSTKGYGIFWNTAAKTWADNRFPSELKFTTEASDAIDYYFFYGPELDSIVQDYRRLTGQAPMFGKWAYGFFQSKDRYKSQDELLKISSEYRDAHVPLDVVVQDWFWWVKQGDVEFRPESYPDVPAALARLHADHTHTMLSVWAMMDAQSHNFQKMKADGLTIPDSTDYDATNPKARDAYWDLLLGPLFAQGWDAFWLDSSEPEKAYTLGGQSDTALQSLQLSWGLPTLSSGARYTNVFPLLHTGGIYEHWRKTTDKKRVFILTRSGFAGQQRNAAVTWSGDVFSTWTAFQRQIPAGLNFALSGMPYWTTDIAGYGPPYARDTHDPDYQELYTRWFEFGVFCPIFRTHGHRANEQNELFSYGAATPTLIEYDKLRYRLLPYIYSAAWQVTSNSGTIMRPLVMDFRKDEKTWNIGDEYMFGPSLLVAPVTQQSAVSRDLYLPAGEWTDFWTGKKISGAKRLTAEAPVVRIPVYVRAGSILPMGPVLEYAEQKSDAPIQLRIYPGANADFTLYDDAGDGYGYEHGEYSTVILHWDDASRTLTFSDRTGGFPGMAATQRFRAVLVKPGNGIGGAVTAKASTEIVYDGTAISRTLN